MTKQYTYTKNEDGFMGSENRIADANERTHGDQMATMGELHGLYKIEKVINERITELEAIKELDNIKAEMNSLMNKIKKKGK